MKISVIPEDRAVIIDGVHREIDCTDLLGEFVDPEQIHAIQFDGDDGEVEYRDKRRPKKFKGLALMKKVRSAHKKWRVPAPRPLTPGERKKANLDAVGVTADKMLEALWAAKDGDDTLFNELKAKIAEVG